MPPDLDWGDFWEKAEQAAQLPDPGRYLVACSSAEWAKTKDGTKDMLVLRHRLVDEPEFDDFDMITYQTYSPENRFSRRIFADVLEAHNVDKGETDSVAIAESMVGVEVYAELYHDEWQGRNNAKLRAFEAA